MPDVEWVSKGAERVIKDFDAVVKATEKHANVTKGSTRATEELGRISQKIIKDTETSWERYTRRVVNAKRAHDDNKISTQQLNREMANTTVALLRETDAVNKETAAQNRNLAVRRQQQRLREGFRLEALRGVSLIQQETASIASMTMQLGNYATKARAVGSAWSQMRGAAGRMVPALGAAAAVASTISAEESASSAAGGRAIASGRAAAGLAELARGDPKKYAALLAVSRQSFREGGFTGGDESGAHALTFELASGDMLGDRAFYSKAQQAGQPAAELAKTVATYREGFKGGDAVGSSEQIVSKAIEAAAEPVGVEAADILRGASLSAQNAKRLGLTDEEHLATVSAIADVTASGDKAGSYADSYYRAMIRQGYVDKKKKSAIELRDELANKKLVMSKLQKELGREEASAAFSILSQPGVLESRISQIEGAQATGQSTRSFDLAIGTPSVATGITVNRLAAEGQIADEEKGLRRQRIDAQTANMRSQMRSELPGGISGPAGAIYEGGSPLGIPLPGISTLIPDAWEDPGIAREQTEPSMDDLARRHERMLLEQANAQRERQLRNQERALQRRPVGRRE